MLYAALQWTSLRLMHGELSEMDPSQWVEQTVRYEVRE